MKCVFRRVEGSGLEIIAKQQQNVHLGQQIADRLRRCIPIYDRSKYGILRIY